MAGVYHLDKHIAWEFLALNDLFLAVSFDYIILYRNFDIKDIKADYGQARYDNATNKIIWEAGNIKTNQVVRLTYYLSLKSVVDESIIESIDLRTNRQIIVTQSGQIIGTYPADDQIDDQICSPTIMILREAIDNPKTGVTNYVILGACLLSVAAITIVMLNRKSQFNRINCFKYYKSGRVKQPLIN